MFIVTPDHLHKAMTVAALAARKDVYLEKPMSYSVEEGLAIIAAMKRNKRVVQVGSQGVSGADMAKARELVKSGRIGKVTMIRAAYNRNTAGGAWLYPIPPDASPQTVNWDQFLGDAPKRPFDVERFFRWRCYWDYSGGIAADLFVHLVSWLHFAIDATMPKAMVASGENYRWKETREVPDTVNALLLYPEGFTANLSSTFNNAQGASRASRFSARRGACCCARRGHVQAGKRARGQPLGGDSWAEALEKAYYDDPKVQASESPWMAAGHVTGGSETWRSEGRDASFIHVQNFFESVRSRKKPFEDALFGHRAAACAHMVNQSIRTKRMIEWNFSEEKTL